MYSESHNKNEHDSFSWLTKILKIKTELFGAFKKKKKNHQGKKRKELSEYKTLL